MKQIQLTLLLFLSFQFAGKSQSENTRKIINKTPFTIGESVEIYSDKLQENRTLNICLPAGYGQDSTKKYPVIYLLDGSADEDFIHIAGLIQFGTFPWIKMLPESILVGISNVDRKRDYTFPTTNKNDKAKFPTTGGSDNFIQFMNAELLPFIESNYRTDTIKTIIGQSLGGLLATEVLFKQPELFTNYIIVSPSLWWDDESLLKVKPKIRQSKLAVYLTAGQEEEAVMVRTATELSDKLKQVYPHNIDLFFHVFEGLNHGNILHLAVYDAFEKIYKTEKKD